MKPFLFDKFPISRYSYREYFIWLIVSCWLIIDSLNGLFAWKGINLPISQFFKLIILFLLILSLLKKKKYQIIISLIFIYIAFYFTILAINNYSFLESFLSFSRFLTLLLFYLYAIDSIKILQERDLIKIKRIINIGIIIFSLNIILGILGFGRSTYGSTDFGLKGLFNAGNELGGLLAVMAPFVVYLIIVNLYGILKYISLLFVLIIGSLVGTKTAILCVFSSVFLLPLFYYNTKLKLITLFLYCSATLIVLYIISNYFSADFNSLIDRWVYIYDNGGLSQLTFSGRDLFWEQKKHEFYNASFVSQFFGIGVTNNKLIEQDYLDSILMYGYFGGGLIILFFFYLLLNAYIKRNNNSLGKTIIFSDLLVIGIGFIAGHVWFSAMASIYIALMNALIYIKSKNILFKTSISS